MTRRVLNTAQPVTNANGTMSQPFQEWQQVVTNALPYTGSGSPEGALQAPQFASYYDTSAAAGSIHYIKMLPDIGGDRKQGWKLA